jgi:hypothetical protein
MKTITASYRLWSVVDDSSPAVDHPAQVKLASFAHLPAGWDFGQGGPLSKAVRGHADRVLSIGIALGLEEGANVFPGANDEIAVAFYRGGECFEVIVSADGSMELFHEQKRGDQYVTVRHEDAISLIGLYAVLRGWEPGAAWSLPDSSTPVIFSSAKSESQTSLLSRVLGPSPVLLTGRAAFQS